MKRGGLTWLFRLSLAAAITGLFSPPEATAVVTPINSHACICASDDISSPAVEPVAGTPQAATAIILSYDGQDVCGNDPVNICDPLGLEGNEISGYMPGFGTTPQLFSGSGNWLYPRPLNGNLLVDAGATVYDLGISMIPRPDLMYDMGYREFEIAHDPNAVAYEKAFGWTGTGASLILMLSECVPIINTAENLAVRTVQRAETRTAQIAAAKMEAELTRIAMKPNPFRENEQFINDAGALLSSEPAAATRTGALGESSADFGRRVLMKLGEDLPVPAGTTGIRTSMANISAASGNEVALLRLKNGTRVLRMGDPISVSVDPGVARVIAHTHPSGVLELSIYDLYETTIRGAYSTVLIDPQSTVAARLLLSAP